MTGARCKRARCATAALLSTSSIVQALDAGQHEVVRPGDSRASA